MHYVLSDIHGEYEKFCEMLKKISFGDSDVLYVLGDVIDRGKQGLKTLLHMMQYVNIIPIFGNHELLAYPNLKDLLYANTKEEALDMTGERFERMFDWLSNGGGTSIREFQELSQQDKEKILAYLREFWGFVEVEVNGRQYLLVHAGFEAEDFDENKPLTSYDIQELVWSRMDIEKKYFKDKIIVFGHTPTRLFHAMKQGKLLSDLSKEEYCDTIYESEDGMLIGIDCAACFGGKLGCICLETGEKFYV